jgi:two-component system phosphate regulon response regulator PhoB/two-component system alkaline phosphatase synthesis response regulator PhoP
VNKLVAVVDDEPDIVNLISIHLHKAHFAVTEFFDGETFLKALPQKKPDLIILDLMLPDADGMDICKYLKKHDEYSAIPIIMLTARSDETDKIVGLEIGADDYVTKPFSPRELIARIKAVLRRREHATEEQYITVGGILSIDFGKFEVRVHDKKIDLTTTEFRILKILAQRKGWVFSRKQILDTLWGEDKIVVDRTVDVHIKHLREKLGEAGRFIKNIRGVGYTLKE